MLVHDQGLGTLEDNEITANTLSGVEIKTGGNPTLCRNNIHDGKQVGVFVQENGLGTLEDNEITANTLSGVEIKTGGNPTLWRNNIHEGLAGRGVCLRMAAPAPWRTTRSPPTRWPVSRSRPGEPYAAPQQHP